MHLNDTEAWHKLTEHKQSLQKSSLSKLFQKDKQRFQHFSVQAPHWLLDYSRHLIDDKAIKLLFALANQAKVREAIKDLFDGKKVNNTEKRAALHSELRNPKTKRTDIRNTLDKMRDFCKALHNHSYKTFLGEAFTDVYVIGIGGSSLGPKFVNDALALYKHGNLRVHFSSSLDPTETAVDFKNINPNSTLFIIASKSFATSETMEKASSFKKWLTSVLGNEECIQRHFVALTQNTKAALDFGINEDNIFPLCEEIGGRFSLWSSIGLPIALHIGFGRFEELLSGAHAMDQHFQKSDYTENLPVILALLGIWYRNFWDYHAHAIIPYSLHLRLLPSYVQQLEMESNGKRVNKTGEDLTYDTAPIVWGDIGTNSQHSFHQLLHQGTESISVDFIAFKHSLNPIGKLNNMLFANCIAQAQVLAFGQTLKGADNSPHHFTPGNKPSSLLLCEKLTPASLGALIAAYEHKAFVQGVIWDINSFDQYGVELGKLYAENYLTDIEKNKASTIGAINWFKEKNHE